MWEKIGRFLAVGTVMALQSALYPDNDPITGEELTKDCPFCREEIKYSAKRCKHCRSRRDV